MKAKLEVTRIDEYEVEIDEKIWDSKTLKEWTETFWDVENIQELGKALATAVMRYGVGKFMEGFGNVKQIRPDGSEIAQYKRNENNELEKIDKYTKGLLVIIHSEDENYYVELDV